MCSHMNPPVDFILWGDYSSAAKVQNVLLNEDNNTEAKGAKIHVTRDSFVFTLLIEKHKCKIIVFT